MAINFPSNPTTGQIFVFNQKKWRWNGYAWDRTPNADLDDQTGILYGGELTANIGGSTFSVASGIGQIVGYTANQYGAFPTLTEITWGDFTGVTLNYLATSDFTRVYIDENGDLQQQTAPFGHEDPQTKIIIGTISHIDRASVALVTNKQHTAYNQFHRIFELFDTFGPIKKTGMNVSANGANLSLDVSAGEALVIGMNYPTNFDEPDLVEYSAQSPADIARIYRDGSGDYIYDTNSFAFYTVVDPSKYDDNSGTLQTVNNNQWTIQRLYVFPNLQNVVMSYYGRVIYNAYSDALAGIQDESFDESTITSENAIFLGYLVVRGGAADLTDPADAHIVPSGFCRVSGGGGGGGGGASVYYAGDGLTLDIGGQTFGVDPTSILHVAGISSDGGAVFGSGQVSIPNGGLRTDRVVDPDNSLSRFGYIADPFAFSVYTGNNDVRMTVSSNGIQSSTSGGQSGRIYAAGYLQSVGAIRANSGISIDAGGITFPNGTYQDVAAPSIHVTGGTPVSANENDFWFETDTGSFYAYIDEGAGLNWVEVSADPAIAVTSVNGATGDVEVVSSYNGATGAIEKIYGCFYNGTGVTFSTSQTTIPLDTVMYNSDPAGLTLTSNRLQINKAGTFKITADLAVGLTGSVAPGSLLVVESQMFKKSGILSPVAVNGTKMYHTIERQDPDASTTVTTEFTVPANASCTMITNGHVNGNSYLLQSIQYWDSGTGLNGNYYSVPAECYRITVEEL